MQLRPGPHSTSSVQPVSPFLQTPEHTPPQPSPGFWQVANVQLGVHKHCVPQTESGAPHSAGSEEGQCASRHTSEPGVLNNGPSPALHTSFPGQVLVGDVALQVLTHAQFCPHGLLGVPQPPSLTLPSQAGDQQMRWARVEPKHAPLLVPHTRPWAQSVSEAQPVPDGQEAQPEPPQSTPVSSPSRTPFEQCGGGAPLQPAAFGFAMQGSWQVPPVHERPTTQSLHV